MCLLRQARHGARDFRSCLLGLFPFGNMSGVNFSTLVRANANFSKPINHVQPLLAADNLRHIRIRGDESSAS